MRFAQKSGLGTNDTHKVVGSGAAKSGVWNDRGARLTEGDVNPGFKIKLHCKDLSLVKEEYVRLGLNLPGLELVLDVYEKGLNKGLGELGLQGLIKIMIKEAWNKNILHPKLNRIYISFFHQLIGHSLLSF